MVHEPSIFSVAQIERLVTGRGKGLPGLGEFLTSLALISTLSKGMLRKSNVYWLCRCFAASYTALLQPARSM